MPRVKITNLKKGACVINSLKLTIPGLASAVRDASVVEDSDIAELVNEGIISIVDVDDVKPVVKTIPATPTAQAQSVPKSNKGESKTKSKKDNPKKQPQLPPKKPGTDFRDVDGPEDTMGAKVVIIGETGPEIRKMGPGINGAGQKYVGDPFGDEPAEDGNFTTV